MVTTSAPSVTFRTTLLGHESSEATGVRLTPKAHAALGGKGRLPIVARIKGHEWRTTAMTMDGHVWFIVPKKHRDAAGVKRDQSITVTLTLDDQPRTVAVPRDMAAVLKAEGLRKAFDAMSFTHRREWVEAVEGAKKLETRQRRLEKLVSAMRERGLKS